VTLVMESKKIPKKKKKKKRAEFCNCFDVAERQVLEEMKLWPTIRTIMRGMQH